MKGLIPPHPPSSLLPPFEYTSFHHITHNASLHPTQKRSKKKKRQQKKKMADDASLPSLPTSDEEAHEVHQENLEDSTSGSLSDSKRFEVSHSPLKPSDARKLFEASCNEEDRPATLVRQSSKGPVLPKAKNGKYTYADLKMPSKITKDQIDVSVRENYLSEAEFEKVFGCEPAEFAKLPKWKRDQKKKDVALF